jgi:glycosyltransferase involved in cell wall biosynthesis
LFHAALVGGTPQRRYFASLGLPQEKIFTGYDAVDNDYFTERSENIRSEAARYRAQYQLPNHYFLSLGRFVAKKNLLTLVRAFHRYLGSGQGGINHLVFVGSGEDEARLRDLCAELHLPLRDKTRVGNEAHCRADSDDDTPAVHFYGFRQIEENPIFYTLADAFILPSFREEWGLVVNEAMACGLPVIVSETAGCAEDLLENGLPAGFDSAGFVSRIRSVGMRRKIRRNGFVFDPGSADELGRALFLMNSFAPMRAAMGRASLSIVNKFSCDNFGKQALLAAKVAMGQKILGEPRQQSDQAPLSAEI